VCTSLSDGLCGVHLPVGYLLTLRSHLTSGCVIPKPQVSYADRIPWAVIVHRCFRHRHQAAMVRDMLARSLTPWTVNEPAVPAVRGQLQASSPEQPPIMATCASLDFELEMVSWSCEMGEIFLS